MSMAKWAAGTVAVGQLGTLPNSDYFIRRVDIGASEGPWPRWWMLLGYVTEERSSPGLDA